MLPKKVYKYVIKTQLQLKRQPNCIKGIFLEYDLHFYIRLPTAHNVYSWIEPWNYKFSSIIRAYILFRTYVYNNSMIFTTIFHWGYMLLSLLGDIFVCILSIRIGLCVYDFHVVHCGSLEQVNIAITSSFGFVYIKSYYFCRVFFGYIY